MQWLLIIGAVCLWSNALSENVVRCRMRLEDHTCSRNRNGRFFVDGAKIVMKHTDGKFSLNCNKEPILESPAMPHFRNELYPSQIELRGCPVPTENSYQAILMYYFVKPQQKDGELSFELNGFNSSQKITPEHFMDLENITSIVLKADEVTKVDVGVFSLLPNLRSLKTSDVLVDNVDNGTGISSIMTNTVQKVQLINWLERELAPLTNCDNLVQLDLFKPSLEQLPESWLAACPVLEKLTIKNAEHISSLPQGLFQGANALKRVTFTRLVRVETLPEGVLNGAPNIVSFEMTHGRLKTLSSTAFQGLINLRSLTLSNNKITEDALNALATVVSLTKLDLSYNYQIKDVCGQNGYSQLRYLTQLKELSFWQTRITRICQDWRENLIYLQNVDLRSTDIKTLTYEDFQFKRNETIKCEVQLDDCDISTIRFTENDYNKIEAAPNTAYPVNVSWDYDDLNCNCDMYWFRKALDKPTFTEVFPIHALTCKNNNVHLTGITLKQMCPDRASA